MILTGNEIKLQREAGNIVISDWEESRLGPNSYNLRLSPELMAYKEAVLDPKQDNRTGRLIIPETGLVLQPGRLYLAKTMEYTETHNLVPMLVGRSSIGRLGLFVHVTAGFGDVGFSGNWTLELTCVQPVRVYPGMEICQIYYQTTTGEILSQYHGKYQGSRDVVASRIYQELSDEQRNLEDQNLPGV